MATAITAIITITLTTTVTTMTENASLLHLLHLVSPALPVGAYAYSQGLETAVEKTWVHNRPSAQDWIGSVMQYSVGRLDVPVLLRCYRAWQKKEVTAVLQWNQVLQAARESKEMLLEDVQMGEALWRLLCELKVPAALQWNNANDDVQQSTSPSFVAMFSLAACHWHIAEEEMAQGFVWSWLENQVAGAIKLIPLGQTEAQCLLLDLMPQVEATVASAMAIADEDVGSGMPRLAMASMQHEVQYSRLFRS
jgi:urease accessory protein